MDGLVVNDLSISFRGIQALKNVSFHVNPGEIVGVIGPNGAGKTTLVNCISRFNKPDKGSINFNGIDLLKKRSDELLSLGVSRSFQDLDSQQSFTVMEYILLGQHAAINTNIFRSFFDFSYLQASERNFRKAAREKMRLLAKIREKSEKPQYEVNYPDLVGRGGYPDLLDVQDVPISLLPYGVKKKADLARTFVSEPRLILLDEPASGLGGADLDEMTQLIKEVQSGLKCSILIVEHKMPIIMNLCDRVVVLDFGEKIADDRPEEIRKNRRVVEAYLGIERSVVSANPSPARADLENPILEMRDVDLSYGAVKALSGVKLKIPDHAITAVIGNNGAGKSSLLKAISGLRQISAGEIRFQGELLVHCLQHPRADKIIRKGIVHVAEGRRILKELSVMENLLLAAYTCTDKKLVKRNIEKVFHYFPVLKEKLKLKDAGNLSGGQQQMLAIGQALMMNPRLLLLDEPSLGLSPNRIEEVFGIIQGIASNEKCAVLIVEQNVNQVLKIASYAYVFETGFVVGKGTPEEMRLNADLKRAYLG